MNFFTEGNFKITFAGVTVDLADIEVLDGSAIKEDTTEAVYEGITIDGSFKDWDAVARYNAACPNEAHKDCLSKAAMVFDGDYVYIYLKDGATGSAYGAGTHSNGRYSIKTDLGRELVFQLTQDGQVNGIDGVLCQHVGRQWEPIITFVIFLAVSAFIVFRGVNKGIESTSKIIMPILLVMILGIAIFSLTLKNTNDAGEVVTGLQGFKIYIVPNFEGLTIGKLFTVLIDSFLSGDFNG